MHTDEGRGEKENVNEQFPKCGVDVELLVGHRVFRLPRSPKSFVKRKVKAVQSNNQSHETRTQFVAFPYMIQLDVKFKSLLISHTYIFIIQYTISASIQSKYRQQTFQVTVETFHDLSI